MAKTILIPTDFTVESLNLAKIALQNSLEKGEKLKVILVYGQWVSSSINDLLFYSKAKVLEKLESEEFKASCQILLGKYENTIEQMTIEIFSGRNQNAFENYLLGSKVTEAYIPNNYTFKLKNSSSFDLMPYLTKSKLPLVEVNWDKATIQDHENSKDELSALFFRQGQMAH